MSILRVHTPYYILMVSIFRLLVQPQTLHIIIVEQESETIKF